MSGMLRSGASAASGPELRQAGGFHPANARSWTVTAARRAPPAARAAGAPSAATAAPTADVQVPAVTKPTLFDVPVSNNGARVRHVIYTKGLEGEIDVVSPASVGGLASPTYKAMNPQGKMPLLLLPGGTCIYESEVINQYILDRWAGTGPSLRAGTPEARALAALATRVHDLYITTVQACMYRAMPAEERARGIAQIAAQLDALEALCAGPFLAGPELTSSDSALFPTVVFMRQMLVDVFGWQDVFAGRPKLAAWWQALQGDAAAVKVIAEVRGGLQAWADKDRWSELGIREQVAAGGHKWAY